MSKNIFADNREFMFACDKPFPVEPTVDYPSEQMQFDLIVEELVEFLKWRGIGDPVEVFDACLDMIKVIAEYGESCGFDMQRGWDEVHRSNMAKVVDGKVIRRADGKILKPEGWTPPNLRAILFPEGQQ